MEFIKTRFRNVFTFGMETQEIDFTNLNEITLISGINGAGKSSIARIIKIGTFIEYDDAPVGKIANDINGNGWIESSIKSRGHFWRIESEYTSKLKSLKLYKDGNTNPEDTGGVKETKEYIQKNVVDIPHILFSNIVVLSIADFKSFLKLNADDTRKIRDRIFSFYILNEMAQLVNKKSSSQVANYNTLLSSRSNCENSLSDLEIQVKEYLEKDKEIESQIAELKVEIADKVAKENAVEITIKELKTNGDLLDKNLKYLNYISTKETLESYSEEIVKLIARKDALTSKKGELENTLKLYNEQVSLERDIKTLELIVEKNNLLRDNKEKFEKATQEAVSTKKAFDDAEAEAKANRELIANGTIYLNNLKLLNQIKSFNDNLLELQNNDLEDQISASQKLIDSMSELLQNSTFKKETYKSKLELLSKEQCPTCESSFVSEDFVIQRNNYEELLETEQKTHIELLSRRDQLRTDHSEIESQFKNNTKKIQELEKLVASLNSKLVEVKEEWNVDIKQLEVNGEEMMVALEEKRQKYLTASAEHKKLTETLKSAQAIRNSLNEQLSRPKAEILADKEKVGKIANPQEEFIKTSNAEIDLVSQLSAIKSSVELLKANETPVEPNDKFLDDEELIMQKIAEIEDEFIEVEQDKFKFQKQKRELEEKCTTLNAQIGISVKTLQTNIEKLKEENITIQEKLNLIGEEVKQYQMLDYILSEEGIKKFMLKDIVPFINQELDSILSAFNLNLKCQFNEDFKAKVYRFGKEAEIISTGQKMIINSSIVVAISKVFLKKYPDLNIVFYDELFSNLHSTNIPLILDMVTNVVVKQLKLKCFIVNHAHCANTYFRNEITVENDGFFSKLITKANIR